MANKQDDKKNPLLAAGVRLSDAPEHQSFSREKSEIVLQTVDGLKEDTIAVVERFLKGRAEPQPPGITLIDLNIEGSVESYTSLMKQLNKAMDARCAIVQHEIDGPTPLGQQAGNPSKITVRDARNTNGTKPEDLLESWMGAMAAQARGAASLLDMNEAQKFARVTSAADEKKAVVKTFEAYCKRVRGASSPKERAKIVTEFNQELVGVLKSCGVVIGEQKLSDMKDAKVIQIMGDARDFCNLGEKTQNHQVTIFRNPEGKGDFIWASMKMNPISEEIKAEYEQVRSYRDNRDSGVDQTPGWFQNLKPHQRELTLKYLDQIIGGNHALPTQLRFLPGLKNAFIDVKGPVMGGKVSEEAYVECHSGALVHNAGTENNKEARRVTALNMRHAKGVVGEKRVVLSVLNTNSILQPGERNICRISKEVAGKVEGVEYHQNGVNLASLNPDASLKKIEEFSAKTNKSGQNANILWTACKSGKDRTVGVLMRSMAKIFGGRKPEEFIKLLSSTGHAEALASGAGATRGAYGLKLKEMFIRMKDSVLGSIRGSLTNSISGVNVMHPTKLKNPIYKRMLDQQITESHELAARDGASRVNTNVAAPSPEAQAQRDIITKNSSRLSASIPPPPSAAAKRGRQV